MSEPQVRDRGKPEKDLTFYAPDDPELHAYLTALGGSFVNAHSRGKHDLAEEIVQEARDYRKQWIERRENVLKRVWDAGGREYALFDLRRYAEELGGYTLQKLETMDGFAIIKVIRRGLEKVYRLRPYQ